MRVNSKGQVTIPKRIREQRGLHPNVEVEFVEDAGRVYLQKNRQAYQRRSRLSDLHGLATVWMTTEEILALTRGD